jgi:outer membrane murein-binding lipoprotein Lpp
MKRYILVIVLVLALMGCYSPQVVAEGKRNNKIQQESTEVLDKSEEKTITVSKEEWLKYRLSTIAQDINAKKQQLQKLINENIEQKNIVDQINKLAEEAEAIKKELIISKK